MRKRALAGLIGAAVLAVGALGACTKAEQAGTGDIEIQDATGETVKVSGKAKKVVALEWVYVEELLALDITPVGVADAATYNTWIGAGKELNKDVKNVGGRAEPVLDEIRALAPELIIAEKSRTSSNLDELREIAPVLVLDSYRKAGQYQGMRDNFKKVAKAVGKQEKASEILSDLDTKIADTKKKFADANKDGAEYALSQVYTTNGVPGIRMFTDKSQAAEVLNAAGLKNAWQGKSDDYGMTVIDIEALTSVSKANFLYVAQPNDDPIKGQVGDNETFKSLEFVKDQRVHTLDAKTWVFGGPLSAQYLLEQAQKALIS